MTKSSSALTVAEVGELIERLAPPDEEMDEESASIILDRAGFDLSSLTRDLKMRLENGVSDMRTRGEEVPPELLKIISIM